MDKWYRKVTLTPDAMKTIGIDPDTWAVVSQKICYDDIHDIAYFLGTNTYIMLNALFEPCEAPGGILKDIAAN